MSAPELYVYMAVRSHHAAFKSSKVELIRNPGKHRQLSNSTQLMVFFGRLASRLLNKNEPCQMLLIGSLPPPTEMYP